MDPAWVRSIQQQCQAQDVPFFFKQWGGVQKSKAGRKLDKRTWDEFPRVVVDRPRVTPPRQHRLAIVE